MTDGWSDMGAEDRLDVLAWEQRIKTTKEDRMATSEVKPKEDDWPVREDVLRGRLDEPRPEAWFQSEAGDTFVGVLVRYERAQTRRGQPATIAVAIEEGDPEKKERSIWLLHSMLFSVFSRERPAPGERFAVRYEGTAVSESSENEYGVWKLVVDRPDAGGGVPIAEALGEVGAHDAARQGVQEGQTAPVQDAEPDDIPF